MSRCFPFPPPGYEKKLTTDDPDLLKKEKRKEKKHKKDKKDKEKKDGKEKGEKDRSDRKHKEKKDKHRDKKKDKEKGKSITSDEKKVGQPENHNGEKLHESNEHNKSSVQLQNGGYEQLHKKAEPVREKSSSSDDKKSSISFWGQNGEFPVQNRIKAEDTESFKFVQELGRRIRDEEKGTGSHQFLVESRKSSSNKVDEASFGRHAMVQNKVNGTPPSFDKRIEEKEKLREKEGDDKRGDKRKNKDRDKQRQGKEKDMEKAKEKSERDKNKHIKKIDTVASLNNLSAHPSKNSVQGVGSEGNFKKRKDTETNGVSHETELRPNKMARHTSNILTENGRKPDFLPKPGSNLSDKQGASLNNLADKTGFKERRVNGIISSQPASISAKKPPKSPPLITNHLSTPPFPVSATKPPPSFPNHIAPQPPPVSSKTFPSTVPPVSQTKPSPVIVANKAAPQPLPRKKPPHPDTKYLNQVLSVPKLDPWCGFDDQDWLFSSKDTNPSSKNTSMEESLQDNKELRVWSEAKHIESVDVCALPYVIPY